MLLCVISKSQYKSMTVSIANFKTSPFVQYLRQAQIISLEILNVWMPVPLYLSGGVKIFRFLSQCNHELFIH